MIISFCGLIASGKDTAADYLVAEHGFARMSFASTLKDAAAAVFSWDRELLEGRTEIARHWREQKDDWWANRLGIPQLTPRWVLQQWGTEVLRQHFHDDIWVASLENKIRKSGQDVVITDCRFPNESKTLRNLGAKMFRVRRGPDPEWFGVAKVAPELMPKNYPKVHASEYSWAGIEFDAVLENNGTIQEFYEKLKNLV